MLLTFILAPLAVTACAFVLLMVTRGSAVRPKPIAVCLGAVTNFFDTLGIGSFAPTMAWMKLQKLVPDPLIPSTMVAAHAIPTLAQSAIFLVLLGVRVNPSLLACSIVAMVIGGQIGAPLARHAPARAVQAMIAIALLVAACFYASSNLGLVPNAKPAYYSTSTLVVVTVVLHLILGILLNFGIGNYAPTLLVFSLIGIDAKLAFPIMSSACAYCMITSSIRVVSVNRR